MKREVKSNLRDTKKKCFFKKFIWNLSSNRKQTFWATNLSFNNKFVLRTECPKKRNRFKNLLRKLFQIQDNYSVNIQ